MKFMESFLANRPKVAAPEPQEDGVDVEGEVVEGRRSPSNTDPECSDSLVAAS